MLGVRACTKGEFMIQRLIGAMLLMLGIAYGFWILSTAIKEKEHVRAEQGRPAVLFVLEMAIYFLATLGISDFLLNTLLYKFLKLGEIKKLPGTLVTCGLTPGAVIAFVLLQVENPVELRTLIPCAAGITIGCAAGAKIVGGWSGARIKKILGFALIGSLIALIIRMIVSQGAAGEALGLSLPKLIFATVFAFFWGAVNMLGVPGKPAGTAVFLLLGLSPLATLTLILIMGCIGPMGGGIAVIKNRRYHQKLSSSAVIFGSIGAILGCLFTISVSAALLNVLLLIVMVIAIISMFR